MKNIDPSFHKDSLNQLLATLSAYLETPEGIALSDRIHELHQRLLPKLQPPPILLTTTEQRALRCIRKILKQGGSASVRDVARAIGCRSSRSGLKVVNALIEKGVVERVEGRLRMLP